METQTIKKDCYKLFSEPNTTFCIHCSKNQRDFCLNIMGRMKAKCVISLIKNKERIFLCSIHPTEHLDNEGLCPVCEQNEQEYLWEKAHPYI